ncbi:adenylate/guanylate cyclase domain-containing protein [Microvirga terricola]|uniref:Adenylate/guanylate cyclase domain-containing protein n=1 Tax=Microvirga terricola TaxID=2719797 RepID=A0ABX0VFV5_9HYPH|nr:adenylate/guanylate cyclase domain-containing protein [Microvirga terricola]NIX78111.1 adenylate/guanylate cyclase domain-containing protein [Microvirga terricola]
MMRRADGQSFRWSLQAVVALVFTLVVLAISSALIGFNHYQLTKLTVRDAEDDFQRISNNVRDEISGSLHIAGSVLDTASLTLDPNLPSEQLGGLLISILKDLDDALPAAMGIFIGRGDGSHIVVQSLTGKWPHEIGTGIEGAAYAFMIIENSSSQHTARWVVTDREGKELRRIPPQPSEFDPRRRPWYRASLQSPGMIITPPYRFASVPEVGITLARQSRQQEDAVFGIDMTLASLDLYLEKLRIPAELELLVFDNSGVLIAHPRGAAYRAALPDRSGKLLTVDDARSPLLTGMFKTFQQNHDSLGQSASFSVNGDEYFGRTERVGEGVDNLFVSLAIPYDIMIGPAQQIRSGLLLISAASVLLALLIVLLASRRLALPLRKATEDIGRIMKFEFGHTRRAPSRIIEVGELSRAIDTLEIALMNFMRYVPDALVRRIIGRKFSADLGGKRQPVTVLFSDVAGFTTMAEGLDPEEVMAKTSRYFSEIGNELVRSGATIDKYIGDSIMAFWNAPDERQDHVAAACLGALRASHRLERLNAKFVAEGGAPMRTRFGMHTGDAVVGNVGSVDRVNYTVLGHTVNMASRFEKLNKRYGTTILVSEDVCAAAGENYLFRFVDRTVPEGAHRPMAVYELLGAMRPDEPELAPVPERLETLEAWEVVRALCEAGDWQTALGLLEKLVEAAPDDILFRVYLDRCRANLGTLQTT